MAGDIHYSKVSLLLHGDGANGSTNVLDSSPRPKPVSAVNGAQISTAQSKFGGSSLLFDGTNDFLTVPDGTDFTLGSGNFTIEAWIRPAVVSGVHVIFSHWTVSTANQNSVLLYISAGKLQLSYGSGSTNAGTATATSISTNVWTHVAAVVSGGVCRYYINGVQDASTYTIPGPINNCPLPPLVGAVNGQNFYFNGHIDDLRITNGVARYTTNFTPPTEPFQDSGLIISGMVYDASGAPAGGRIVRAYNRATGALVSQATSGTGAGDADYSKVSLLLKGDGANGSTTIVDSSQIPKAVTVVGDAKISTAQSKFGGSSLFFDGSGDRLTIADVASLELGTSDLTIEAWIYIAGNGPADAAGNRGATIINAFSSVVRGYSFSILGNATTTGTGLVLSTFANATGAGTEFYNLTTIAQNTWHHVAATVQSGVRRLFLNGTSLTGTAANYAGGYASFDTFGGPINVGGNPNSGYPSPFNGYIDDLRVTRGLARYTANFTPPTSAHPANQFVSLGAYSLPADDGLHTVVCLDDDTAPDYNALVRDRVVPV